MNYKLLKSEEDVRVFCDKALKCPVVGFDTETTSLDPHRGELRLGQIALSEREVGIIDFRNFPESASNPSLNPLRRLLESSDVVKTSHNAKFDWKWAKKHLGCETNRIYDTLLGSQIIGCGDKTLRHGLGFAAERFLGREVDKGEQTSDWSQNELSESQLEYAARDAAVVLELREEQIKFLKEKSLVETAKLEFECVPSVAQMELNGFYLDRNLWQEQLKSTLIRQKALANELQDLLQPGVIQRSMFGRFEINLESPAQILQVLQRMKIPVESIDKNKLEPLFSRYPVLEKVVNYNAEKTLNNAYGETMYEYINPVTGRVHADFRQIGAPTGRFSCSNPNMQKIPHDEAYRQCFRAPKGRKLIIADYSQIQLRILADISGDRNFIDAFLSGQDFHTTTAAQVFGVPIDQVTHEQRSFAKRLNFGVVFGIGAQRFAMMTGLKEWEAENFFRKYFSTYRKLDQWLRQAKQKTIETKQAKTLCGRVAEYDYDENERGQISQVGRLGMNMPIQGTEADIVKIALASIHKELRNTSACLVNIVHDETITEEDEDKARDTAEKIKALMEDAGNKIIKKVPVKVDVKIADSWAEK